MLSFSAVLGTLLGGFEDREEKLEVIYAFKPGYDLRLIQIRRRSFEMKSFIGLAVRKVLLELVLSCIGDIKGLFKMSQHGIDFGYLPGGLQFPLKFIVWQRVELKHEGFGIPFPYFVFKSEAENEEHLSFLDFLGQVREIVGGQDGREVLLNEDMVCRAEAVREDFSKVIGQHLGYVNYNNCPFSQMTNTALLISPPDNPIEEDITSNIKENHFPAGIS